MLMMIIFIINLRWHQICQLNIFNRVSNRETSNFTEIMSTYAYIYSVLVWVDFSIEKPSILLLNFIRLYCALFSTAYHFISKFIW